MLPEAVFDVDRVLGRVGRGSGSPCCPARRRSTRRILDHPDRDGHDLSTLRVAVTGAADIPVELIRRIDDELPFSADHHRLRADRGRHRGGHLARRRRRDHRHHRRPAPPGLRAAHRRRHGRGRRRRRAGRDPAPRRQHHVALPRRSRGDGRGALRRRLAAHRRPRRRRRRPAACASSAGRRTCSSSAASTPTRPRSRTPCCAIPTSQQAAVIGVPDERLGEVGMAFVVAAPGRIGRPAPTSSSWSRDQMANYKVPRSGRARRRAARSTPPARS